MDAISFRDRYASILWRRCGIRIAVSFCSCCGLRRAQTILLLYCWWLSMKNFIVKWSVDVEANSYEEAAAIVASQYFQKRIEQGQPDSACVFEVLRTDADWKDANPVVVDLSEGK
ncbi:hypothetical protein MA12_gp17 [Pectobacterium phage MA12]|uniref:Uncharacterized protein n=1 Tax=Pectobacterium phage MA12 TaxID=2686474 RepID=A0A6B9RKU5_9CAUD|nr:hypothetical protein JT357_gp17 [Pectobacterium phage MA12]QHI00844.1 hypothetical protein MA12_gp17 [Pectobacterium phage MA12]